MTIRFNSANKEYGWLSNFYPARLKRDFIDDEAVPSLQVTTWVSFNSVEHAFQASKCVDSKDAMKFLDENMDPVKAKYLGKTIKLRPDWEVAKDSVMEYWVRKKFKIPELREKLFQTGYEELVEYTYWHDQYWGVCSCNGWSVKRPNCTGNGQGKNKLGQILMKIRGEIQDAADGIEYKCDHSKLYEGDVCQKCRACFFLDDDDRVKYMSDADGTWNGPEACLACKKPLPLGRLWCNTACMDKKEEIVDPKKPDFTGKIVAVTGHRPDKLGGYDDETLARLTEYAMVVLEKIKPRLIITGMALGWDTAVALACVEMSIPFHAYIPGEWQPTAWKRNPAAQARWHDLCHKADRVVNCDPQNPGEYAAWKLQSRNEQMIDNAQLLLALWNGSRGGTYNAVDYARKNGRAIIQLWSKWEKGDF